ncbi:MAG TPA: sugar ABC transporter substrate-binding protein [Anaerolineales bacterium]|nr:sugar ABC transporter substrate-binding protein [Anaerolineales bacterium]
MLNERKRLFVLLALVLVFALALGACKPADSGTEAEAEVSEADAPEVEAEESDDAEAGALSGEITIWAWDEVANQSTMDSFMELNPGVTVEQETVLEYEDTFFASLVAGAGLPDAAWMDAHSYQKMARTGQLMPLDELLAPYKDDITPALWEASLVDGHIYGVPRRYAPQVLWYRIDRFEEVGIDPASLKTWDDFMEQGKKALTDDEHFMTCADPVYLPYIMEAMLFSNDGTGFFDADDNVVINSPENVVLMEKYLAMVDAGLVKSVGGWEADWYDALDNAKCASYVIPYWFGFDPMNDFENPDNKGNWGMLPLPSLESNDNNASIWQGALYWVIPTKAENPDLAWEFVKYNTFAYEDPIVQASFDEEFVLPAYMKFKEVDYPFLPAAMEFYGANLREQAYELSEGATANYMPPEFMESQDIYAVELTKALAGEQSAQEALDNTAEQIKTLLDAR